ncbi:MAG: FAD-dependent protein [Patescibacteria group bacterium]
MIEDNKKYDVLIVGAGPAGLFAAYEIVQKSPKTSVCLVDMGKSIKKRSKKDVMTGVGGAGTFSDGKLHFTPVLSHEKMFHLYPIAEYQKYIDYVDKLFTDFGVDSPYTPENYSEVNKLVDDCKRNGIHLFIRKARHVGTDVLSKIIGDFEDDLRKKKVEFKTETEVTDLIVKDDRCQGVITKEGKEILAVKVILAPGRIRARWLQTIGDKYQLEYDYEKVEVGIRVEFPSVLMKKYTDLMYETIFLMFTPTFDDPVRTFCPCPNGMVATETYDGFVCVNGHSNSDHQSPNSNFAFVTEITLTEPVENTTQYAKSIAHLASTIGGGKPILQRLVDLRKGHRSTWKRLEKSFITPTLKDVTPGDISMALPHRVVTNLLEGLEMLDKILPGINNSSTLLYCPEIKLRSSKIRTDRNLQTSKVSNLYVAGDGAGLSGNIVGAAITGVMAGRGVMGK